MTSTKQKIDYIFFPCVHDPKSVLLKRGCVLTHEVAKRAVEAARTRRASLDDEVKDLCEIRSLNKCRKASPLSATIDTENEKELLLFTHGFAIANVLLEDVIEFFLALGDKDFSTLKGLLDHVKAKFLEMCADGNDGKIVFYDETTSITLFTEGGFRSRTLHITSRHR